MYVCRARRAVLGDGAGWRGRMGRGSRRARTARIRPGASRCDRRRGRAPGVLRRAGIAPPANAGAPVAAANAPVHAPAPAPTATAPATAPAVAPPVAAAAAATRSATALENFGLSAKQLHAPDTRPEFIQAHVSEVIINDANRRGYVVLDNGQTWVVNHGEPLLNVGEAVTVKRAALGWYCDFGAPGVSHCPACTAEANSSVAITAAPHPGRQCRQERQCVLIVAPVAPSRAVEAARKLGGAGGRVLAILRARREVRRRGIHSNPRKNSQMPRSSRSSRRPGPRSARPSTPGSCARGPAGPCAWSHRRTPRRLPGSATGTSRIQAEA